MLFSPSWATIKVNFLEDLYLALIDFLNTFILSFLLMFIIASDVVFFIFYFFCVLSSIWTFFFPMDYNGFINLTSQKTYPCFTFGLTNGFVPLVIISTTMA
jgi:hypothetical protein